MLGESKFEEIYIACGYTDLRYGIDGLATTVKENFGLNPFSPNTIFLFFSEIFNEAESLIDGQLSIEPSMNEVIVLAHKRRKRKGKLNEDLMGLDTRIIEHTLSDAQLQEHFPQGYKRLPDEVYKKLELIPAVFEVHEHHIAVYKGRNGKIVKAEHPKEMLNGSIATPSIVSAVIHGKYTNAVPLYRQEQEFTRNDVNISRQTMANWVKRPMRLASGLPM